MSPLVDLTSRTPFRISITEIKGCGGIGTVGTICQGSSGGFVDDKEDLEASNLTSILCGLSLSIIEVSGDGYDCVAKTSNLVYTRITYELLPFIADVDLDSWTAISLFDNLKGPKTM